MPALREQGISEVTGLVDERKATSILDYFSKRNVLAADGRLAPMDKLPRGARVAPYPLRTVLENTDVLEIVNAPAVMRICEEYLGCKPTLSSLGVRWSFPGEGPATSTQDFHRDLDDWCSLKLFVYLTDVDLGSGPHAYVLGSHRTTARLSSSLYSRDEIDCRYGPDQVRVILGPRGTAFIADTFGIHAGMVPAHGPRLILQAQYSILPVFAFLYEPVKIQNKHNLDRYITRLLIASA